MGIIALNGFIDDYLMIEVHSDFTEQYGISIFKFKPANRHFFILETVSEANFIFCSLLNTYFLLFYLIVCGLYFPKVY
jgi:hypothetical protein